MNQWIEFDEYWKSNPLSHTKLDIYIIRKRYGLTGKYKTQFKPRKKVWNCDNICDKRGFMRYPTKRR